LNPPIVILAGTTGDLGEWMAVRLRERGETVRAAVRGASKPAKLAGLSTSGIDVVEVDFDSPADLALL